MLIPLLCLFLLLQSSTPAPVASGKPNIAQFTAEKTRLKKNAQAKLVLVFRSEPPDAKLDWRVTCQGVAITGWDSPVLLRVASRSEEGVIEAIEGRDYAANRRILIVVKGLKTEPAVPIARCTAAIQDGGGEGAQKSVEFQLR